MRELWRKLGISSMKVSSVLVAVGGCLKCGQYLSLSMQKRKDIPSTLILTRSKAHEWINVCLWIFSKFLPFLVGLYSFSELSPDSGAFSWVGYFLRI